MSYVIDAISLSNGLVTGLTLSTAAAAYTDEQAQDAVGGILVDSDTIDFTYSDSTPSYTAEVKDASITPAKMDDAPEFSVLGRGGSGTGVRADIVVSNTANAGVLVYSAGDGEMFWTQTFGYGVLTCGEGYISFTETATAGVFTFSGSSFGFSSQLSLSLGGTGSDLSATGPGVAVQASTGAALSVTNNVTLNSGTTPTAAITLDMDALSSAGQRDSHWIEWVGRSHDGSTAYKNAFRARVNIVADDDPNVNEFTIESKIDSGSWVEVASFGADPYIRVNGPIVSTGLSATGQVGCVSLNVNGTGSDSEQAVVRANSAQTAYIQVWKNSSGSALSAIDRSGRFCTQVHSAPADADIVTGELFLWFDQTAGAAKLKIKAKNASGTVVTGEVALS